MPWSQVKLKIKKKSLFPNHAGPWVDVFEQAIPFDRLLAMPNANSTTVPQKRILVVDDGPELPKALRLALTITGGYKIDIAADGKVALQMFEAGIYDAVITDLKMPFMDGLQLAGAIKARSPKQPIILITAHLETLKEDRDWQSKIDFLLAKPFSLDELQAVLAMLPGHSPAEGLDRDSLP
ncbi:MAG TPA: response regulator [Verrucomicrobiae bacterium]|nr:response regulator [Verrucomicrobiae bacterium]